MVNFPPCFLNPELPADLLAKVLQVMRFVWIRQLLLAVGLIYLQIILKTFLYSRLQTVKRGSAWLMWTKVLLLHWLFLARNVWCVWLYHKTVCYRLPYCFLIKNGWTKIKSPSNGVRHTTAGAFIGPMLAVHSGCCRFFTSWVKGDYHSYFILYLWSCIIDFKSIFIYLLWRQPCFIKRLSFQRWNT